MTELEKISYAKSFIDALSDGINPLDNSPIPETDIARNERLSKCFAYVSGILQKVIDSGTVNITNPGNRSNRAFVFSDDVKSMVRLSDKPMTITEYTALLNLYIHPGKSRPVSMRAIQNWLVKRGLLEIVTMPDGKTKKLPTRSGNDMGIFKTESPGEDGNINIDCVLSKEAQKYILSHLDEIEQQWIENKKEHPLNHNTPWTKMHEEYLVEKFKKGVPIPELAKDLKRTETGIRARLVHLGLIENRYDV